MNGKLHGKKNENYNDNEILCVFLHGKSHAKMPTRDRALNSIDLADLARVATSLDLVIVFFKGALWGLVGGIANGLVVRLNRRIILVINMGLAVALGHWTRGIPGLQGIVRSL